MDLNLLSRFIRYHPKSRVETQIVARSKIAPSIAAWRGRTFLLVASAEEHQYRQSFRDVVKRMFHAGWNKDDRTGTNLEVLRHTIGVVHQHLRVSARDVVDLVFLVGRLRVLGSSLQNIDSDTQRPRLHKLQISFFGLCQQFREVKDIR